MFSAAATPAAEAVPASFLAGPPGGFDDGAVAVAGQVGSVSEGMEPYLRVKFSFLETPAEERPHLGLGAGVLGPELGSDPGPCRFDRIIGDLVVSVIALLHSLQGSGGAVPAGVAEPVGDLPGQLRGHWSKTCRQCRHRTLRAPGSSVLCPLLLCRGRGRRASRLLRLP